MACRPIAKPRRARAPPKTRRAAAGLDADTPRSLALLVAAGTPGLRVADLDAYARGALLIVPPGVADCDNIRRELARLTPAVRHVFARFPSVHSTVPSPSLSREAALTLHAADAKSQWSYLAVLYDAARRLGSRLRPIPRGQGI